MFTKDRQEHVNNVIKPRLEAGEVVIVNRYVMSTIVYQSLTGISATYLWNSQKMYPFPQLTFVLHGSPRILMTRIRIRSREGLVEEGNENLKTLEKVNTLYKSYADVPSFMLIDTDKYMDNYTAGAAICVLHGDILELVQPALDCKRIYDITWDAKQEFENYLT